MPNTTDYLIAPKKTFNNREKKKCDKKNPTPICKIADGGGGQIYLSQKLDDESKPLLYKHSKGIQNENRVLELPLKVKKEFQILDLLKKKNICNHFVCHYDKDNDGFYMKNHANYKTLDRCIRLYVINTNNRRRILSKENKKEIAKKLIILLNILHDNSIAHCDLKPANIMVLLETKQEAFEVEDVKIIDFGGAIVEEKRKKKYKLRMFDPRYSFLETNKNYDFKNLRQNDMFSLGVILLMLIGVYAAKDTYDDLQLQKSQKNIFKKLNILLVEFYGLPKKMVFFEPKVILPLIKNNLPYDLNDRSTYSMLNIKYVKDFLRTYIHINEKKDFLFENSDGDTTISPITNTRIKYTGLKIVPRVCPNNYDYNDVSNRCKKKIKDKSNVRCPVHKVRNPKTNRCVRKSSVKTIFDNEEENLLRGIDLQEELVEHFRRGYQEEDEQNSLQGGLDANSQEFDINGFDFDSFFESSQRDIQSIQSEINIPSEFSSLFSR
jgi:serine/threonine protein kinase